MSKNIRTLSDDEINIIKGLLDINTSVSIYKIYSFLKKIIDRDDILCEIVKAKDELSSFLKLKPKGREKEDEKSSAITNNNDNSLVNDCVKILDIKECRFSNEHLTKKENIDNLMKNIQKYNNTTALENDINNLSFHEILELSYLIGIFNNAYDTLDDKLIDEYIKTVSSVSSKLQNIFYKYFYRNTNDIDKK